MTQLRKPLWHMKEQTAGVDMEDFWYIFRYHYNGKMERVDEWRVDGTDGFYERAVD